MSLKLRLLLISITLSSATSVMADPTDDAELLARHGVKLDASGVTALLDQLRPDPTLEIRAKELIDQLGSDEFETRHAAMRGLIDLPIVPLELLLDAKSSNDLETAYRARKILEDPKTLRKLAEVEQREELVSAALRNVASKRMHDVVGKIIQVAPHFNDSLSNVAADTLCRVATEKDEALLRQSVRHAKAKVKVIAIRAFAKVTGESATSELSHLLEHSDERVVLTAAHALVDLGARRSLVTLVQLLESEDLHIRVRSEQLLRAATGHSVEFNPFASAESRRESSSRWQAWLAARSETAKLVVPLEIKPLPEDIRWGLQLHLSFDDDPARRIHDSSGKRRHGVPHNDTRHVPRGAGRALQLVGLNHHGDRGGHVTLPTIDWTKFDVFTIALWVNEKGMTHPEGEAYISFGIDRGVGVEDALGIAHFNSSLLFRVGGDQISVPYAAKDRDRWVHFAMTYKAGHLTAYRDGDKIGRIPAKVATRGKMAGLGRHWWGDGAGTSARFLGILDDVRIYDRALSTAQLQAVMSAID